MQTLHDRFWSKVNKTYTCWLWTGAKHRQGYGSFKINNKTYLAHRVPYFLATGSWPDAYILHSCDTPACVNPAHHFTGNQKDNMQDAARKKRIWQSKVTHCPQGHEYTPENTYSHKGRTERSCKRCKNTTTLAWYHRTKKK